MKTLHETTLKVQKEVKITNPLYTAELDNGVKINVYGDYALGTDGKRYYHVGYEDDSGVLITLGWSCEADMAVIV
ncbi:MAG: hypothetical protein NC122_04790 [Faecalibacterium sp.]|nr:hypothetical protein [Ruminococcus sp.]MCM1391514.1 hypothetical protein [Ruminococcus sp.]MCM1485502.1 hypothetical protein [Faecalibacterium sp.]